MNTFPRKPSYADVMALPVEYSGMNPVAQHLFCNGSPLVTDVFDTLEEAVLRFGGRINTREKEYRLSGPWNDGVAASSYAPRPGSKGQEKKEFSLGYIHGLLARSSVKSVIPKPASPPPPPGRLVVMPPKEPLLIAPPVVADTEFIEPVPAEAPAPEVEVPHASAAGVNQAQMARSITEIIKPRRGRPPKVRA